VHHTENFRIEPRVCENVKNGAHTNEKMSEKQRIGESERIDALLWMYVGGFT
jgi:hypothetical protein